MNIAFIAMNIAFIAMNIAIIVRETCNFIAEIVFFVCVYVCTQRKAARGSRFVIRELEKACSREKTVSFFSQNKVNNSELSAFDTVKHKNLMCTLYS